MKVRLKGKYLPSFHRVCLVDQMIDLQQSNSYVSNYRSWFNVELVEDLLLAIARFICGLLLDFRWDVTFSSPFTLDEALHKVLQVEILNKRARHSTLLTRPPPQLASKAPRFLASASKTKTSSLSVSSKSPLLVLVFTESLLIMSCNVLVVVGEVIMLTSVAITPLP